VDSLVPPARKVSPKFRDWAERLTGKRFVQAFVFAPLLLLTMALLQLPLDIVHEIVLKTYRISVQTWPSWTEDWAKGQFLTMLAGDCWCGFSMP